MKIDLKLGREFSIYSWMLVGTHSGNTKVHMHKPINLLSKHLANNVYTVRDVEVLCVCTPTQNKKKTCGHF